MRDTLADEESTRQPHNDVVGAYQGFLPCGLSDPEKEIDPVLTRSALLIIGR